MRTAPSGKKRKAASVPTSKRASARKRKRNPARKREKAPATGIRSFWKGFLAFGLVQIPIELHSAEAKNDLDFDLLDRRDMAPIGYLKVNKETGEEVPPEEIVRGVEISSGRHVVVTDEEIENAAGESSRTIEVSEFVERDAIPATYFERPLHLSPGKGGEKVYALLVRALTESGKLGVARVVLRARESLAAIYALDGRLVLNLLRWPEELKPAPARPAVSAVSAARASARELAMARQLIAEMSGEFRPADFHDRYRKELLAIVRRRARTGSPPEPPSVRRRPSRAANVVDLVALLEQSVRARKEAARPAARKKRSA